MKRFLLALFSIASFSLPCQAQEGRTNPASPVHEDDDDEKALVQPPALRIPTGIGNYFVGADLLFAKATFQKGYEASYTGGISPKAGAFILPNLAIGLSLNFTVQGNKSYRSIDYGASPFARVYFAHNNAGRVARPLQAFVEAGIGIGGTNSRYENASSPTVSTNGVRLSLMPGVDYFLNSHVAVEAGLGYQFIGGKPDAHIVALNVGLQVFLGR